MFPGTAPPSKPVGFQMESVNSTSFHFKWGAPSDGGLGNEDISSYLLECEPHASQLLLSTEFPVANLESDKDGVFAVTLSGFLPGTLYNCTLLAVDLVKREGDAAFSSGFTEEQGAVLLEALCAVHI